MRKVAENGISQSAGTIILVRKPMGLILCGTRKGTDRSFKICENNNYCGCLWLQRMPTEVQSRRKEKRHLWEMCAAMFGQPRSAAFATGVSFSCEQLVLELFHVEWAVIPPQTSTIVASIKRNDIEKRKFLLQNGTDRFLFLRARRQWRDFTLKVYTILKAWTAWTVS